MARWSELPCNLLKRIEGHIGMYVDKIRFRCVCTQFRQSVSDLPDLRKQQLPYETGSMCGLYDPLENKLTDIDLPEAGEKVFRGTGHGWVVTLQLDGSIDVVNPLTRNRVRLPPRYKFPDVLIYDPDRMALPMYLMESNYGPPYVASSMCVRDSAMEKVVLSSSPLSDDFVAVAVFSHSRLAYCKVGDSEWRYLVEFDEESDEDIPCVWYKDVTFLGGKLYAISRDGELMVCDDIGSCPRLTRLTKCDSLQVFPYGRIGDDEYKLTSLRDSLVIILRKEEEDRIGFEMYRLDVDPKTTTGWIRIESLGDDEILFMGLGTQILFSSQDFIGNRIYFAGDRLESNCGDVEDCFDNGVFNFGDGSF